MKHVMATMVVALVGCAGPKNDGPPPREPLGTTETTSASSVGRSEPEPEPATEPAAMPAAVESSAPVTAAKETDRGLATKIQSQLRRYEALEGTRWRDRVRVVVEDQHVTLRGNLSTLADSTELERAVRSVKGVRAVTNEIQSDDAYRH